MKKCLIIFLILSVILLIPACDKDGEYAWVLVDIQSNEEELQNEIALYNEYSGSSWQYDVDVTENSAVFTDSCIDDKNDVYRVISGKVTWNNPPSIVEGPDYEFSIQGKVEVTEQEDLHGTFALRGSYGYKVNDTFLGVSLLTNETGEHDYTNEDTNYKTLNLTLTGKMDEGHEERHQSDITIVADGGHLVVTKYIYEWQEQ